MKRTVDELLAEADAICDEMQKTWIGSGEDCHATEIIRGAVEKCRRVIKAHIEHSLQTNATTEWHGMVLDQV
jgi:hypothetical protein